MTFDGCKAKLAKKPAVPKHDESDCITHCCTAEKIDSGLHQLRTHSLPLPLFSYREAIEVCSILIQSGSCATNGFFIKPRDKEFVSEIHVPHRSI